MIQGIVGRSKELLDDPRNCWMIQGIVGRSKELLDDPRNCWMIQGIVGRSMELLDDPTLGLVPVVGILWCSGEKTPTT